MNITQNQKLGIMVLLVLVSGILLFNFVPVIIDKVGLGESNIFIYIGLYLALVYPIANSLRSLRVVQQFLSEVEEEDIVDRFEITDWIPFINDWKFSNLYDDGSMLKRVVCVVYKASIILLPVYLLYLNIGIVFIDLGYNFTIFMMNSLVYVILAYIFTKVFSVANLLIELGSPLMISVLLGVTVLFGYMYIPYTTRVYMERQYDIDYDKRLGQDYEY